MNMSALEPWKFAPLTAFMDAAGWFVEVVVKSWNT